MSQHMDEYFLVLLFQNGSFMRTLSYENESAWHENEPVGDSHMNGFACT